MLSCGATFRVINMTVVAGIDGCPYGWLCLTQDKVAETVTLNLLSHIKDFLSLVPTPEVVAIDVPIGLPESGQRACDQTTRKMLGWPRGASVFSVPPRQVLSATSRDAASEIRVGIDGRRVSSQSWAIAPKIKEVDEFLREDPNRQSQLHEVHPELCFWQWNGRRPMRYSKKTRAGKFEREALVISTYGHDYSRLRDRPRNAEYRLDDLLDAFAALHAAERLADGTAEVIPESPPSDAYGLPMRILL
jgi:predicted RNase H-like nuclease